MEKRPQIVCCTNLFPHGGNSNGVLHPFSRKRGNFIRSHSQSRFAAEVYPQVTCFSFFLTDHEHSAPQKGDENVNIERRQDWQDDHQKQIVRAVFQYEQCHISRERTA